ncbi:hypothetical protein LIZ76_15795 [Caldibacillus sp. 210928-DFI.2.22]|uniref:hypothetical protein n=1 Tax=unclassified Caldibacillus TaxID=2641266 RepID=UPI001D081DBA|nr:MULTISPECIES: hypothetical protein [unclassified Caldibacillus]MCB7071388.1 hypothetical protein [Caldibacillus sp. 210928-DFI.2.22]MCB7073736.1 hypothetical protein [Caldibacillus sp. 210928-DFI.2.18]
MQQELKNKFQDWTKEIDSSYKLILTNDLDSLFTVAILKYLFGCQIGLFYDFNKIYSIQPKNDKSKLIGCDLAAEDHEIKTFCNHVTRMTKDDFVNPNSANLNNFATRVYGGGTIHNTTYFRKYSGSTLLTVLSLYNAFDKLILPNNSELTEEQLKILACIDSYFYGAYHPKHYEAYKYFQLWQEAIGLKMFKDIFDTYTKDELIQFQNEHKLRETISAYKTKGGYKLITNLPIDYLQEHFPMLDFNIDDVLFITKCTLARPQSKKFNTGTSKHDIKGRVFSLSVINRHKVVYTLYPN